MVEHCSDKAEVEGSTPSIPTIGVFVLIIEVTDKLCLDLRAREWCKLKYPDHPKGCPNYGKKLTCPPLVSLVGEVFDLSKPHWFVIVEFHLFEHFQRMMKLHSNWSERQARCVLYWQGKVNKQLKEAVKQFSWGKDTTYTLSPEAMGVNVILTLKRLGIPVETKPKNKVLKVALVGSINWSSVRVV
jgi:predicted metal-binding protein